MVFLEKKFVKMRKRKKRPERNSIKFVLGEGKDGDAHEQRSRERDLKYFFSPSSLTTTRQLSINRCELWEHILFPLKVYGR